ncbi:MAG: phosphatidylglycerophosphatase A [Bryobacteraceae bacterium]
MPNSRSFSPATIFATWFGAGFLPAPGTAGSAGAILAGVALHCWLGAGPLTFAVLAAAFLLPGVWASTQVARERNLKDPQIVVIDEVLGQWVVLAGAASLGNPWTWLMAFGLFRLFDIWKPFPIRRLEKLPEGWGVVMDDILAGVYGAVLLRLLGWWNLV